MALGRAIVVAMGIVSVGISTRYLGVDACGALATAIAGKLLPPANEGNPFAVLLVGGTSASAAYLAALYAFKAMPSELHTN